MRIDENYNFLVFILRKERNGFITVAEFNEVAPRAQLDVIGDYYEIFIATNKLPEAIRPLKSTYNFTKTTSPGGLITVPSDFMYLLPSYTVTYDNARGVADENNIRIVSEGSWVIAERSQLRAVSKQKPIGIENAATIQLAPKVPQAGVINYLKLPTDPVYGYTLNGRTVVYDSGTSVQFTLGDMYQNKIIAKILSYSSINLGDDKLLAYSQLMNQETVI